MSSRGIIVNPGLAVGARIRELRESLPPPPDRTKASRIPHPSQEEFAEMVGTDRFRVIDWERNGAIPDRRYRIRLAELSAGRYTPDDFTVDAEEQSALVAAISSLAPTREEYHREIQALKDERDQDRKREDRRYRDLRAEIKRLKEAS